MTRSAVAGKVYRLGMGKKKPRGRPKKDKAPPVTIVMKPKVVKTVSNEVGVAFKDLKRNQCQFPLGGRIDKPIGFCGGEVEQGKPYCTDHCEKAYRRIREDD